MLLRKNLLWLPIPDGVDLFFVLSGFLIGNIIIKTFHDNQSDSTFKLIRNFWLMRWFRTLPNYYWISFIVFILNGFKLPIKNLLFLQNFYKLCANPFPETWSLAVEEWYYLLLPGFIFLMYKLCKSYLIAFFSTVCIFIVVCFCFKLIQYHSTNQHDFSIFLIHTRNIVLARLDSIAVGFLGAVIYQYYPKLFFNYKWLKLTIGLVIILVCTIYTNYFCMYKVIAIGWFGWNFNLLIMSLGILLLFPFLLELEIQNKRIMKFITLTSTISYSMYLIHKTILLNIMFLIFLRLKTIPIPVFILCYLILLYLLSYINYHFIEEYFLKLRYKFIRK